MGLSICFAGVFADAQIDGPNNGEEIEFGKLRVVTSCNEVITSWQQSSEFRFGSYTECDSHETRNLLAIPRAWSDTYVTGIALPWWLYGTFWFGIAIPVFLRQAVRKIASGGFPIEAVPVAKVDT